MKINTWIARLLAVSVMFCAATAPVLAQSVNDVGAGTNATMNKQETEYKTQGGTVEVERERNLDGTVSTEVDRDWSAGTWLAIGLGVLLLAGLGIAFSRRHDTHIGTPAGSLR